MILPRNFAGSQVTLVVNLSPTLKHWSGMLAFPEKQKGDRHLAGLNTRSRVVHRFEWSLGWIDGLICRMIRLIDHQQRLLHNGVWQRVPWVPSLFPGLVEVQHVVGASREGGSMVRWLLSVPISAGRGQWSLYNGWGR